MASARPISDIRIIRTALYRLPLQLRTPLRFGSEPARDLSTLLVEVEAENRRGERGRGWGEVPLNLQWLWPDTGRTPAERAARLTSLAEEIAGRLTAERSQAHPMEIALSGDEGESRADGIPTAAAAAVAAAFDIAVHDAWGTANRRDAYDCYLREALTPDLSDLCALLGVDFTAGRDRRPSDYLHACPAPVLPAWHMVGGEDPLTSADIPAGSVEDGYPRSLEAWIRRDGISLVKIKLLGTDFDWDYRRLVEIAAIGIPLGVEWISVDFNCTVHDEEYLLALLQRLMLDEPRVYGMLLFVEQPFPADESIYARDVRSLSALKPLFLDEAVTDPRGVTELRDLGWSGLALKSCKGQTASVLTACLGMELGMPLMVQDLTNPRLAMISHAALAARVPTLMGLETNACQFYPDESLPEERVHPGLFRRRNGAITTDTISGPGIGYRIDEIERRLPVPFYGGSAVLTEAAP